MIRKPDDGTIFSPVVLIVVLTVCLAATIATWWFNIVSGRWSDGATTYMLGWSQSLDCLAPWRLGQCRGYFDAMGQPTRVFVRTMVGVYLPVFIALAILAVAAYQKWFSVRRLVILSGMVVEGMPALRDAARRELKLEDDRLNPGIPVFNGWHYSRGRETRHTFIFGAPGSGKTVTFTHMINAVTARNDKALIFDEKGDYTALVPPSVIDGRTVDPLIIAPQDERSAVWDIAADLIVPQDAVELAHRLIPDTGHPFFTQSARAVLAGCAIKLMAERPGAWTWGDLLAETRQDQETLLRIMLRYQAGSDIFLTADYKQVMSTLGQLETEMRLLDLLATAWADTDGKARFSLRHWLVKKTEQRTVIVQHSGRYAELSDSWISAFYAVAVSTVTDSNLLSNSTGRRIWFFLDEWGQLPAIKDFERFVTLGRSKGICTVLGVQDLAQIEKNYGRQVLDMLLASVGTRIITRINFGPTAERLQRDFGHTDFNEFRIDRTGDGPSKWIRETRSVPPVKLTEFSTMLGADRNGITAFVAGVGENIYHVRYGYPDAPDHPRPANAPATWTKTFNPVGTFTEQSEIDRYVHQTLGDKPRPRRGPMRPEADINFWKEQAGGVESDAVNPDPDHSMEPRPETVHQPQDTEQEKRTFSERAGNSKPADDGKWKDRATSNPQGELPLEAWFDEVQDDAIKRAGTRKRATGHSG